MAILVTLACSAPPREPSNLSLEWRPDAKLNAELPQQVRVFSGEAPDVPLRAWYALIDEPHPEIITRVVVSDDPQDGRETVSSIATDTGACVAVNGGYFRMDLTPSEHVGLLYVDGRLVSAATPAVTRDSLRYETARAALGFTFDDRPEITWVTTRDEDLWRWSSPPRHRAGEPALALDYDTAETWEVRDAVAAGPALVVGGEVRVTDEEEVFFGTTIPSVHPRTAAGITARGGLVLMVVDGRQASSRGVDLRELAELMRRVGAVEALNLDGGGSSALVVRGRLVNRPTGGTAEREVMSAIATFCGSTEGGSP